MKKTIKTLYATYRQDPSDVSIWFGKFTCPDFYNGYKGNTMQEVYDEIGSVARSMGRAVVSEGMTLPQSLPLKELQKKYKGQGVMLSSITIDTKTGEAKQVLIS